MHARVLACICVAAMVVVALRAPKHLTVGTDFSGMEVPILALRTTEE
jgi:hypothetical protein